MAGEYSAFRTLEGYVQADRGALVYNYAFDISYAGALTGLSTCGLTRFSGHQDELNVIYALNGLVGAALLFRTVRIIRENGIFRDPYRAAKAISNPLLREKFSEYKMIEVSNSARQLRKISSTFSLVSSLFVAGFSEGMRSELVTGAFMAGVSIFYLFFYESYGEDVYEKYFFFKKAYPEMALSENGIRLNLNFVF